MSNKKWKMGEIFAVFSEYLNFKSKATSTYLLPPEVNFNQHLLVWEESHKVVTTNSPQTVFNFEKLLLFCKRRTVLKTWSIN